MRNETFEYFNITTYTDGKQVIHLADDTAAIIQPGRAIKINQKDPLSDSDYKYSTAYLDKQMILDLADYIRSQGL
jgi:hypothetical protein